MEEGNKGKRFRIESVYYEFSVLKIVDEYTHEQYEKTLNGLTMISIKQMDISILTIWKKNLFHRSSHQPTEKDLLSI